MPLCKSHLSFATGPTLPGPVTPPGSTHIWADRASAEHKQLFRLQGDVRIGRDDQALSADAATYYRAQDRVDVKGHVHVSQGGLAVEGAQGSFNLKDDAGHLDDARYQYDPNRDHGRARRVAMLNRDVAELKDATLTTCDPGDVVWYLKSSHVTLNKAAGWGRAVNTILHFEGVPIMYLPYISFPISHKRKSGFLIPSFHSSSRSGLIFSVPYYWDIAPNYDATLTPYYMTRRGMQYDTEFRYLTHTGRGSADLQVLPNDRVYGGSRAHFAYDHRGTLAPYLSTDIQLDYVTDKQYMRDFGMGLSSISTPYLDNHVAVSYRRRNGYILGRAQAYQAVNPAIPPSARPYQQLPELFFDYNPMVRGRVFDQSYDFGGQFIRFYRQGRMTVNRIDLHPSVSLPFEREAGYFRPSLTVHYSRYLLSGQGLTLPADQTRVVPVTTVDTGIYLERNVDWGSHHWIQTLEPRLYYLYVPYVDQSQLPVVDTGEPNLNMSYMFSDNRYNGIDRIGDNNRLTMALTSRLLGRSSGRELVNASVGEMLFFSDRRVTLPGEPVLTDTFSNLVAQASATFTDNLTAFGDLIWDHNTHILNKGAVQMRYRGDSSHLISLSYRYRRQPVALQQTDISVIWPLARQWRFVGRWNYSLRDKRNLETLAGIEYDSCCWGARAVWRQFVSGVNGGNNSSIMIQLVLKGLTNIGNPVASVLEGGILGYSRMR